MDKNNKAGFFRRIPRGLFVVGGLCTLVVLGLFYVFLFWVPQQNEALDISLVPTVETRPEEHVGQVMTADEAVSVWDLRVVDTSILGYGTRIYDTSRVSPLSGDSTGIVIQYGEYPPAIDMLPGVVTVGPDMEQSISCSELPDGHVLSTNFTVNVGDVGVEPLPIFTHTTFSGGWFTTNVTTNWPDDDFHGEVLLATFNGKVGPGLTLYVEDYSFNPARALCTGAPPSSK